MVGKALYEGILLNVAFAPFFITRLQVGARHSQLRQTAVCTAMQAAQLSTEQHVLCSYGTAPLSCLLCMAQGRTPMLDDLRTLDPDLYRSLMQVGRVVACPGNTALLLRMTEQLLCFQ
jgi:hypothetical protein